MQGRPPNEIDREIRKAKELAQERFGWWQPEGHAIYQGREG
jgi:hypothetical protein